MVFGAVFTRSRPILRGLHIVSLIWGILTELLPWPCPLTMLENWLEQKAGVEPYQGGFLLRYMDKLVYPDISAIALGRSAGFSLDEIALMFAPDGRPRLDRQMLAAKAKELDRTIRKLTEMRDGLRHASACRAPSHMERPTFRRILQAAASGAMGARLRLWRAPKNL